MIYIFEIFKHEVSDIAFGWQISRGMLAAFPPPGYLRYLGADYPLFLQCFLSYLTRCLIQAWGFKLN